MNEQNQNYLSQHIDILSFRDLAAGTVTTYASYMTQFIEWAETSLPGKSLDAVYNPKHKAELALLYSSGMRVSELCRLKCKDIYHSRHCIYIARSKNRSDRYAVLSEKAYALLVTYICFLFPLAGKEDWLFPGQKAGTHIHPQSIRNIFQHWLAVLNLANCSGQAFL